MKWSHQVDRWLPVVAGAMLALSLLTSGCREDPLPGADQENFALQLQLSTNQVTVGDVFLARLAAAHPAGTRMQADDPGHERAILLRQRSWTEDPLPDGRIWTEITYALTSLQVGTHALSTGTVTFAGEDNALQILPFPEASIRVDSVLAEGQAEPEDVKDLLAWGGRLPRWIPALLVVAVLAVLVALVAALLIKKPQRPSRPPPPVDPHAVARRALQHLLAREYIEHGLPEPYYVELSAIVRRFLELKFTLRAPEQTTEEFIRDTAASDRLTPEQQERVVTFLEQSDLVKFARLLPMPDDMRAAYTAAEQLVEETRKVSRTGGSAA